MLGCRLFVRRLWTAGMLLVAALSASSIPQTVAFCGVPSFASGMCRGAIVSAGRARARISALGTRNLLEAAAHIGRCNTRPQSRGHALLAVASSASEESIENNGEEQVSARFMSRRAKRRRRTMPDTARWKRRPLQADEDRWRKYLEINTNDQGIQVLLDLDNASDSIDPIELFKMQDLVTMKGFAGVDYSGKTPEWLPIKTCSVRAKNGADFLVAFEAGCIAHEAELKGGAGSQDDTIAGPMVIIVSNDLAMNVLVAELESRGLKSHLLTKADEVAAMARALRQIVGGTGWVSKEKL